MIARAAAVGRERARLRGPIGRDSMPALAAFAVVIVLWEVGARTGLLNDVFFSAPTAIAAAGLAQVGQPRFWADVAISVWEFVAGFALALALGVPLGLLAGWYRPFRYVIEPWLNALNSLPRLALLPLVVLWTGLGLWSKIVIVFLGVMIPVAVNTLNGVATVDRRLTDVAASFGASDRLRFRTLVLPATMPFILAGSRIGVSRGVAGVVVGEFYTSQAGLANMTFRAGETLQVDLVLFGAIAITVLALSAFGLVSAIERRVLHWRPALQRDEP